MVLEKLDSNLQNKTRPTTDHLLTTYTKVNPTWIKTYVWNLKPEKSQRIINTGSILVDIGRTNVFVDIAPEWRETQAKIMGLRKNKKLLSPRK